MDARAYFADKCTAGSYDNKQYLALDLLGKVLRYSVDLSGAGCGCNAALYLTSMRQNTEPSQCSDYYCDANNVCGESCAEIDVQEANQLAWHSTLHTATDPSGVGGGYGGGDSWTGPRDWGSAEYGDGARCVDTARPFQVAAAFPVDGQGSLVAMEVTLSQRGKPCNVSVRLDSYDGMAELSRALEAGMTPIVSYWSANDMLWMDGKGADGKGPCAVDDVKACSETVTFRNFSVAPISTPAPRGMQSQGPASSGSNASTTAADSKASATVACPGEFDVPGYGSVQLIPTGWADPEGLKPVDVSERGELVAHMDGRAYFADECTAGKYDNKQYLALDLLGKVLSYSVDLSGAGCGCNAAFYLTSLSQNTEPSQCSDYYCDANNVCGESCAEIDVQEANQLAWHSTLHAATDPSGVGGGYGGGDSWTGPRDWGSAEYGEGARCVDTARSFQVAAAFPVDGQGSLVAMEVTLSQPGKPCNVSVRLDSYDGMAELSRALEAGMTPIVSYWSAPDMLWMDGKGADGKGPCAVDDVKACSETVTFRNFSVAPIGAVPAAVVGAEAVRAGTGGDVADDRSQCAEMYTENCASMQCCKSAGMQCYVKNEWWAACKEACVPGSQDDRDPEWARSPWSCKALGPRAPSSSSSSRGTNASHSRQRKEKTPATGRVVVKARAEDLLPDLAHGSEVTLLVGGQEVRAEVTITGPAVLGTSALLQ